MGSQLNLSSVLWFSMGRLSARHGAQRLLERWRCGTACRVPDRNCASHTWWVSTSTSTPKPPFKIPHMPSSKHYQALNRSSLGGLKPRPEPLTLNKRNPEAGLRMGSATRPVRCIAGSGPGGSAAWQRAFSFSPVLAVCVFSFFWCSFMHVRVCVLGVFSLCVSQ